MDAGKLRLTLVTPERSLVEHAACDEVTLPSERGELGILPGHTALITLLGIGTVTMKDGGAKKSFALRGGFAEIAEDDVRLLADQAVAPEAVDAKAAEKELVSAEQRRLEVVGEEQLDAVNADAAYAEAKLHVVGKPA